MTRRIAWVAPYVGTVIGIHVLASAWLAILIYHVFALAAIWITPAHPAPGVWPRRVQLAAIPAGLAGGVAMYLVWDVAQLPGLEPGSVLEQLGLSGAAWWVFCLYFVTVHPWIEELLWRRHLRVEAIHPAAADLLFGGYHAVVLVVFVSVPFALLAAIAIAMAGWAWRQMRFRYALLSHVIADIGVILAAVALGAR